MIISDIKAVFYKIWYQKASALFDILSYATKLFIIEVYLIVCIDSNSLVNCFCIFIISRLRHCILDLDLGFLDIIVKVIGKVI